MGERRQPMQRTKALGKRETGAKWSGGGSFAPADARHAATGARKGNAVDGEDDGLRGSGVEQGLLNEAALEEGHADALFGEEAVERRPVDIPIASSEQSLGEGVAGEAEEQAKDEGESAAIRAGLAEGGASIVKEVEKGLEKRGVSGSGWRYGILHE
jgi:hypothetical protein